MPDDLLDVEGLDELQELIARFPELALDAAEPAMDQALVYLHGRVPEYPPKPQPGQASKWWTPKQRRYFWWALKQGLIQVPYKRTGLLGRRITEQVTRQAGQVLGEIGMNTPYGPEVVGPPQDDPVTINGEPRYQARIHEGRWWRFHDVMDENLDEAYREFREEFFRQFGQEYASETG